MLTTSRTLKQETRPLNWRRLLVFSAFLLLVLQMIISPTLENILSTLCAIGVSLVTFLYLFGKMRIAARYPLSALAILGVNVATQSGTVLFQTLAWTPIEYNLFNPLDTFFYVGLFQLALIAAHFFYVRSRFYISVRHVITQQVLSRLWLFKQPTATQLWTMGLIGVSSIWFAATSSVEYGDVGGKLFLAFIPLCYAPYLIPFIQTRLPERRLNGNIVSPLLLYTLVLFIVGMARNSRGIFATAFITIALVILLFLFVGRMKLSRKQVARLLVLAIPAILLFWAVSDLALAMVIVRESRKDVVGFDLVQLTFSTFLDRDAINAYKTSLAFFLGNYNEQYISNPIFARLITTKFDDNMIHYASLLGSEAREQLLSTHVDLLIAMLPTPLLDLLGSELNKGDLEFSIGDYIWYMVSGVGLGGYRLGSMTADGLIISGPFFYVLVLILAPVFYLLLDIFSKKSRHAYVFSPLILIFAYEVFALFTGDSWNGVIGFFLRVLPQMVVIYLAVLFVTHLWLVLTRRGGGGERRH